MTASYARIVQRSGQLSIPVDLSGFMPQPSGEPIVICLTLVKNVISELLLFYSMIIIDRDCNIQIPNQPVLVETRDGIV